MLLRQLNICVDSLFAEHVSCATRVKQFFSFRRNPYISRSLRMPSVSEFINNIESPI